jgi:O-antigen biosynthesis protein
VIGRIKLIDLELSQPLVPLTDLGSYPLLRAVVRWHGQPIGEVGIPVRNGACSLPSLLQAIFPQLSPDLCRQVVVNRLRQSAASNPAPSWRMDQLLTLPPIGPEHPLPPVTIGFVVRSSGAHEAIVRSLQALQALDHANLEILVLEALPADDRVQVLVQSQFPDFHYLRTATPSLNAARNLAIEKAQGEVIAFTDERGVVHPDWAKTVAQTFAAHADVMAVTGWCLPAAIEQDAQALLERGYSPSRGARQRWHRWVEPINWVDFGTMQLGSGLNMAFRRSVFDRVGRFDLALDVPGVTGGGGDLEFWSRILLAGQTLLYEPAALVRWQMPTTPAALRSALRQEIIGLFSYLSAGRQRFPHLRSQWGMLGLWKLTRLLMALVRPHGMPRLWIAAELQGALQSLGQYGKGLQRVAALPPTPAPLALPAPRQSKAVRLVDVTQPLPDFVDVTDYWGVQVYVRDGDRLLGEVLIVNKGAPISRQRLATAIAAELTFDLLALPYGGDREVARTQAELAISQHWTPPPADLEVPRTSVQLPLSVPVSVIITTCDRPEDLHNCLQALTHQQSPRQFEIVVADNRPHSGITKPVVDAYAGVRYVAEPRPGGAYGRNAAIVASTGEIVITVDDDVTVPPDWVEKLLAPLVRPEVMVVMGHVLPIAMDTPAQDYFEKYRGGLGNGFQRFEVDGEWMQSFTYGAPPIGQLGVSANAAFRSTVFADPAMGLMDEVLGPGMPTVGGEENYLVYKILRAGYTMVYEPDAYVWHRHRRDLPGLYRQVAGHMKGGAAFHWAIWFQEKDVRGLKQMIWHMPKYLLEQRVIDRLLGKHDTPWKIIWYEITGYFGGLPSYWQSVKIVKQRGRSAPYIPVDRRGERNP